jgi:hypothetical protein
LFYSPKGSHELKWEPFGYHITTKKEGYKTSAALVGSAGMKFLKPSPDGKEYLTYIGWYSPKDKEKIFANRPSVAKLKVNYDLVFELIKEETKEKGETTEEKRIITE